MSKVVITVILPSLNVVNYIEECIKSVLESTLTDIEVLCVDAGSTDGTVEVIEKYIAVDSRVKLIKSDKKSYGYQVNIGIDQANGEYVGIVDTDDFVSADMYEVLYTTAKNNAFPDYVKSNHDMFVEFLDGRRMYKIAPVFSDRKKHLYNQVVNPNEWPEILAADGHIWKGIYKKEFLLSNNIRLNESMGAAFQDNGFLFQTICLANRVIYIENSLYRYRRDNENASVYNANGFKYVYNEYEFIDKFMKINKKYEFFYGIYYKKYFMMLKFQMEVLVRQKRNIKEFLEDIEIIRQKFLYGYENGTLISENFTFQQWVEINILLKGVEEYYEYMCFTVSVQNSEKERWIVQALAQQKIVIFGKGDMGSTAYFLMDKYGVDNMYAWCDNNPSTWGKEYMGKMVYSPDELFKEDCSNITFVIANMAYTYEIRSQLIKAGIKPDKIIHYKAGINPLMTIM